MSWEEGGVLSRYRHISPMYWAAVTLYLIQSSQYLEAENLSLMTMEMPEVMQPERLIMPPTEW